MTRNNSINNNIQTEDQTMPQDILSENFREINAKLDKLVEQINEMTLNGALKNKDYDGKFDNLDIRVKILEDDKSANARKPIKYEIVEKVITGTLYGFGGILSIAIGIMLLKGLGLPVATILKALLTALGV